MTEVSDRVCGGSRQVWGRGGSAPCDCCAWGNWRRGTTRTNREITGKPRHGRCEKGRDSPIWFSTNRLASNRKAPSSFLLRRLTSTTFALFRLYSGPFIVTSSPRAPFSRTTAAVASVACCRGLPALPAGFWLGGSAMLFSSTQDRKNEGQEEGQGGKKRRAWFKERPNERRRR